MKKTTLLFMFSLLLIGIASSCSKDISDDDGGKKDDIVGTQKIEVEVKGNNCSSELLFNSQTLAHPENVLIIDGKKQNSAEADIEKDGSFKLTCSTTATEKTDVLGLDLEVSSKTSKNEDVTCIIKTYINNKLQHTFTKTVHMTAESSAFNILCDTQSSDFHFSFL